jgi:hypothetical protein
LGTAKSCDQTCISFAPASTRAMTMFTEDAPAGSVSLALKQIFGYVVRKRDVGQSTTEVSAVQILRVTGSQALPNEMTPAVCGVLGAVLGGTVGVTVADGGALSIAVGGT